MKIGYFSTEFPYKNPITAETIRNYPYGGVENGTHNLAVQMTKRGHEVFVFTSSIDSKDFVETYNKIKIYRYGKAFTIGYAPMSFKLLYKPLKYEVDIVHARAGNPPAPIAGLIYAKKRRKPFIVSYHGDGEWISGGLIRRTSVYFYSKYLLDKILSYADVIISTSEYYISESRVLGKYRDKIVVVPNGINKGEFDIGYSKVECREKLGLPIDDEMILFLGGLAPHKGPDVLLKAMPKILKDIPNVKLVFVGDGGMKEELERLCKKMDVEKYVKFTGFVGDVFKKALYYKAADVFVLPSLLESFGNVNLEAMACSLPIVASKVGGVPAVVKDGENGLLVQPRDLEVLANAVIHLLDNEDVREKMGKDGRKKVEEYSWEKVAEDMEKVYLSLIKA